MESKLFNWLAEQPECFHMWLQLPPQTPTLYWDAWNDCAVVICPPGAAPLIQTFINNGHVKGLTVAVFHDGEPMQVGGAMHQRTKS